MVIRILGFFFIKSAHHRDKSTAIHTVVNQSVVLYGDVCVTIHTARGVTKFRISKPRNKVCALAAAKHVATGNLATHAKLVFRRFGIIGGKRIDCIFVFTSI